MVFLTGVRHAARAGAGALLLLAAPGSGGEPVRYPPRTILLFVAGWCAPCHAEIARLDAIGEGARPFAVRVVLLDETRQGRAMIRDIAPAQRWQPDTALLHTVQAELFADAAGLPYSVAIGPDGRPCANRNDGLDAVRARLIVQACLDRPKTAP